VNYLNVKRNPSKTPVSRNHKAIDAVIGRLVDVNGRALMVRTNSKDDPNLNFTFSHAIRDMLADQRDQFAIEKLGRMKGDLSKMLAERGRLSTYANQTAETATALGEIEEQMSHLAKDMTESLTSHLDEESRRFPTKAILKVVEVVNSLHLNSPRNGIIYRILTFFKILFIFPSYRKARRKLKRLPDVPLRTPNFKPSRSMNRVLASIRLARTGGHGHRAQKLHKSTRCLSSSEVIFSPVSTSLS
jgi:hypothetical protein